MNLVIVQEQGAGAAPTQGSLWMGGPGGEIYILGKKSQGWTLTSLSTGRVYEYETEFLAVEGDMRQVPPGSKVELEVGK